MLYRNVFYYCLIMWLNVLQNQAHRAYSIGCTVWSIKNAILHRVSKNVPTYVFALSVKHEPTSIKIGRLVLKSTL